MEEIFIPLFLIIGFALSVSVLIWAVMTSKEVRETIRFIDEEMEKQIGRIKAVEKRVDFWTTWSECAKKEFIRREDIPVYIQHLLKHINDKEKEEECENG